MDKRSRKSPKSVPGRVIARGSEPIKQRSPGKASKPTTEVNGYGEQFAQEGHYDTQKYYTASNKSPKLTHRHVKKGTVPHRPSPNSDQGASQPTNGGVRNMKQKLSHNIEHYSNLFQEITFPILFKRTRSNSRNRRKSGGKHDNNSNEWVVLDRSEDEYPAIENIELYQFDGFVFGSERESGKGHSFQPLQLNAPTWCDQCGDFIWGVYKQCLRCQSECSHNDIYL